MSAQVSSSTAATNDLPIAGKSRYRREVRIIPRKYRDGSGEIIPDWRDYFRQLRKQAFKLDVTLTDLVNDLMQDVDWRLAISTAVLYELGVTDNDDARKLQLAVNHGYDAITLAIEQDLIFLIEPANRYIYMAYIRNWARIGDHEKVIRHLRNLNKASDFVLFNEIAIIGAVLGSHWNLVKAIAQIGTKYMLHHTYLAIVKGGTEMGDSDLVWQIITKYNLAIDVELMDILVKAGDVKNIDRLLKKYGSLNALNKTILAASKYQENYNLIDTLFEFGAEHAAIIKYAHFLNNGTLPAWFNDITADGFSLQQFKQIYERRKKYGYYDRPLSVNEVGNKKPTIYTLLVAAIKHKRVDIIIFLLRFNKDLITASSIYDRSQTGASSWHRPYGNIAHDINKLAGELGDVRLLSLLQNENLVKLDIVGYWAVIGNQPNTLKHIIHIAQNYEPKRRIIIYGNIVKAAAQLADMKQIDQMANLVTYTVPKGVGALVSDATLSSLYWLNYGLDKAIIHQHIDTITRLLEYGVAVNGETVSVKAMEVAANDRQIGLLLLDKASSMDETDRDLLRQKHIN